MRQIVLDTETTGLETSANHRIIEIGAVELINRKHTSQSFHVYINPQREVDEGAASIHGMTLEDLKDKPLFKDIADDLIQFIDGAELIIHNAPFDVGFLNYELSMLTRAAAKVEDICKITDSLALAREFHPGQRNNLDSLCKRYGIDNSLRTLHGALLDAEILADVYLAMTGGQITFLADSDEINFESSTANQKIQNHKSDKKLDLVVITPSKDELAQHEAWLDYLDENCESGSLWRNLSKKSNLIQ
jgi:DNA polymerase-3 subunit epsilon